MKCPTADSIILLSVNRELISAAQHPCKNLSWSVLNPFHTVPAVTQTQRLGLASTAAVLLESQAPQACEHSTYLQGQWARAHFIAGQTLAVSVCTTLLHPCPLPSFPFLALFQGLAVLLQATLYLPSQFLCILFQHGILLFIFHLSNFCSFFMFQFRYPSSGNDEDYNFLYYLSIYYVQALCKINASLHVLIRHISLK